MNSPLTRSIYRLIVAAGLALVLASCTSDGSETAELTITTPEDELTTTTAEVTTTTSEATTTATTDPKTEAEALIRVNAEQDRENWVVCSTDPSGCDAETVFAETTTGQFYNGRVELIAGRQEEGRISRHPDDIENNDFLRVEEVTVADDLLTATASVCIRDGRAGWIPGPDGEYVMLDETYGDEFALAERFYVFEDNTWKIQSANVIAVSIVPDEEPVCDPE